MKSMQRFDLAPKRKRPLSLWNPLDYLLLLYWVFCFPQAVRWYVENFCEPLLQNRPRDWQETWDFLVKNSYRRMFFLQVLLLSFGILTILLFLALILDVKITRFTFLLGFSQLVITNILFFIFTDESGCIFVTANTFIYNICAILSSIISPNSETFQILILPCLWFSILTTYVLITLQNSAHAIKSLRVFGYSIEMLIIYYSLFCMIFLATRMQYINISLVSNSIEDFNINSVLLFFVSISSFFLLILFILRFEEILLSRFKISRCAILRSKSLTEQLYKDLTTDCEIGLYNVNQVLQYSSQYLAVHNSIHKLLKSGDLSYVLKFTSLLSDKIYDIRVLESLYQPIRLLFSREIFKGFVVTSFYLDVVTRSTDFKPIKEKFLRRFYAWVWDENNLPTTTAISIILSFYLIYKKKLVTPIRVFKDLEYIEYGREMYDFVILMQNFSEIETLIDIAVLKLPAPTSYHLRPKTWKLVSHLISVANDIQIITDDISRAAQSFALNRALGTLKILSEKLDEWPSHISRIERPIIREIILKWSELLLNAASEIGQITIETPVRNPYIIGDPVIGHHFKGRDPILRHLKEAWLMSKHLQSILLYGHRRMGKTSILLNAAAYLGSEVNLAYVNLLSIGSASNGLTDILLAICDAIENCLQISSPSDEDLWRFPEITFRRYLQYIDLQLNGRGLIIALDEFEKIEDLILNRKLNADCLEFLRSMVQLSSRIAFVFAGLHTLEEMNSNYFEPFYASFIPIKVGFLSPQATDQVLTSPDLEFPLQYEASSRSLIYDLTHGHPYLIQLIGFFLVRQFNDLNFEQGKPQSYIFNTEKVREVCNNSDFFETGFNYFNGVWLQSSEGSPNQQTILQHLALDPYGLSFSELCHKTQLNDSDVRSALEILERHDVIMQISSEDSTNFYGSVHDAQEKRWGIVVELFRRWVATNHFPKI